MACCFCSFRRMKTTFLLLNTILWFAGPALLGVSIWQYIKLMSYDPVLEISKFEIPVIIYITAGIASTFNGIIGCVGGVNGRKGAILLFLFFIVVIFGAEVYASVELFRFYDEVPGYIHGRVVKFTHDYYFHSASQKQLDNLQLEECSEVLEEWTKENLLIIGWGGFSFSVVQVFGIVLSSCFYYTLRNEFG
ncbi:CD9 antigen-like isoform X2 [Crassostrea angulata]|uniref:CD9 antigen-like isoform X2 n=1 Tax=Magallana angulata TaxID=2784310 RepID=UPI0022B0EE50|nr:CD9 antigen-like isoform X2 [Crassostrea angulata]